MANVNQYGLRGGRMVKTDNTIVNEADGINADGSRNVLLTGSIPKKGLGFKKANRVGALAASTIETVLTTTSPIIIDSMDFVTNFSADVGFQISGYDSDGTTLNDFDFPYSAGVGMSSIVTPSIVSEGQSLFGVGVYTAGNYKIYLKQPIELPKGGVIKVRNANGVSYNVAAFIGYRTL